MRGAAPAPAWGVPGVVAGLWLRLRLVQVPTGSEPAFVLALLLAAYPIARLELGRMPLYLIDVLIGLLLASLVWRGIRIDGFGRAVLVYLALWIPAWLVQVTTLGILPEPTYGLLRNGLAVGCFFVGFGVARSREASRLAVGLVIGILATSILAIAQEVWLTQQAVQEFLAAAAPAFASAGYRTYPNRAFAFFQAATTLSGFLAIALLFVLGCLDAFRGRMRLVAGSALLLIGPAMIATYSRQWLPALALGLLVRAVVRPASWKRDFALVGVSIGLGLAALGVGVLDATYFEQRWSRLGLDDPNVRIRVAGAQRFVDAVGESVAMEVVSSPDAEGQLPVMATGTTSSPDGVARSPSRSGNPSGREAPVLPQVEGRENFSGVAREQPWQLLVGRGFAAQDLDHRKLVDEATVRRLRAGESDNAFLMEILNHGPLAGLAYAALLLVGLARGIRAGRRPGPHRALVAGLAPAIAAAIALHFFDHYFSEAVFMKALLWLFLGLMLGLVASEAESTMRRPGGVRRLRLADGRWPLRVPFRFRRPLPVNAMTVDQVGGPDS